MQISKIIFANLTTIYTIRKAYICWVHGFKTVELMSNIIEIESLIKQNLPKGKR